jgi:hypothetical protein
LYFVVFSYPFSPNPPATHLIGTVDENNITIANLGGNSLGPDTEVLLSIGGSTIRVKAGDYLNDMNNNHLWDMGEELVYHTTDISYLEVRVTVVDKASNFIIMTGLLQEGINSEGGPPMFDTPSPADGSTGNLLSFSWSIPINDPDGDSFNWAIQCSNGQSANANSASNGTKSLSLSGLIYSTTYTVHVNAVDPTGSGQWTRRLYTFTTKGNSPPVFGTPSPTNGSTGNPLSFSWSIPINDPEGNSINWAIQCSNGRTNSGTNTNGTRSLSLTSLTYSTTYKIWVNATDPSGSGLYTRRLYTFTTSSAATVVNLNPNIAYDYTPSGTYNTLTANQLTMLAKSDDSRYPSADTWSSSWSDNERIEFNFPDIPTGASVSAVTLNFEWSRTSTAVTAARLQIYDGSSWYTYSLSLGSSGTDVSVTLNLFNSPYSINTAAKVNNLQVWFQAQSNNGYTSHDWVQVDVTYT